MDDYFIQWRLTNAAGETIDHPHRNFPLGLDMWYSDQRLHFFRDRELLSWPPMKFVSSTIMKMVSRPTPDGGTNFRFKGKSYPMDENTPWSYLHWYPDSHNRTVPHHILMQFGTNTSGLHAQKPGQGCRMPPIKFLLHRTDLLGDPNDESAADGHDLCYFDVPVGIFWGLMGLRTLDRWWVVPDLVEHSSWFATHGADPASYRPVNGTLPRGVYLKVRIGVAVNRQLSHGYFRVHPRGEIITDDQAQFSDAEGSPGEESDYDDYSGPGSDGDDGPVDSRSVQGGELVMYGTRSYEEQSVSHGRRSRSSRQSKRHTGQGGFYGSPEHADVTMMSPRSRDEFTPALPRRRTTHDRSKGPSIPKDLKKFEDLYIDDEPFGPELFLEQSAEDQDHLVRCGTGLGLDNNLSSSVEDAPRPEMRRHRKHRSRGRYPPREDEDYMMDSEELDQYPERGYSSDDHPAYHGPRSDLPVVPSEEFEGLENRYHDDERYYRHDAHEEPQELPRHHRGHRSHRRSHYSDHPEEEESIDESILGSPHARNYVPSRYQPGPERGFYEAHEIDNIGTYRFQDSSGGLDRARYMDREDDEDEAVRAVEGERPRRRRSKKSTYEAYH